MKDKLNISDAQLAPAMAMPMGGMPGPAAAGGAETEEPSEPVEEKTEFDVKLTGFDDKSKIKVIKEVRAVTSLGLKEVSSLLQSGKVYNLIVVFVID